MQKIFGGIVLGAMVVVGIQLIGNSPSNAGKQVSPVTEKSSVTVASKSSTPSVSDIERSVHQQINQHRKSQNLPALTLNSTITDQARSHSQAMANGSVPFGHTGFTDKRLPAIAKVISYSAAAENVAYNKGHSDPATKAVQGWLGSSGHRRNIEGNYDLTGVGVAKNSKGEYYFTQIFIKRR